MRAGKAISSVPIRISVFGCRRNEVFTRRTRLELLPCASRRGHVHVREYASMRLAGSLPSSKSSCILRLVAYNSKTRGQCHRSEHYNRVLQWTFATCLPNIVAFAYGLPLQTRGIARNATLITFTCSTSQRSHASQWKRSSPGTNSTFL